MKPRLLDLFCGAGGAAMGYARAGFEVVGVDIKPQPHYPFAFHEADAGLVLGDLLATTSFAITSLGAEFRLRDFDAIHASPPCQPHVKGLRAVNATLGRMLQHDDLIELTRGALSRIGLPYVIENVVGAPLRDYVQLCGTSFGLPLRRHRLFESNVMLLSQPCAHGNYREPRYWTSWVPGERRRATTVQVYGNGGEAHEWPAAMGIDWMTRDELAEAIPPAYTEWIGRQLLRNLPSTTGPLYGAEHRPLSAGSSAADSTRVNYTMPHPEGRHTDGSCARCADPLYCAEHGVHGSYLEMQEAHPL